MYTKWSIYRLLIKNDYIKKNGRTKITTHGWVLEWYPLHVPKAQGCSIFQHVPSTKGRQESSLVTSQTHLNVCFRIINVWYQAKLEWQKNSGISSLSTWPANLTLENLWQFSCSMAGGEIFQVPDLTHRIIIYRLVWNSTQVFDAVNKYPSC